MLTSTQQFYRDIVQNKKELLKEVIPLSYRDYCKGLCFTQTSEILIMICNPFGEVMIKKIKRNFCGSSNVGIVLQRHHEFYGNLLAEGISNFYNIIPFDKENIILHSEDNKFLLYNTETLQCKTLELDYPFPLTVNSLCNVVGGFLLIGSKITTSVIIYYDNLLHIKSFYEIDGDVLYARLSSTYNELYVIRYFNGLELGIVNNSGRFDLIKELDYDNIYGFVIDEEDNLIIETSGSIVFLSSAGIEFLRLNDGSYFNANIDSESGNFAIAHRNYDHTEIILINREKN